nr:divalent metal cation transporter [Chitinophagaceae bacterium]
LLYIAVPFLTHPDWWKVIRSTLLPTIHFNKDFFEILVAILGTTISPYLFFWQVTMEAEDVKQIRSLVLAGRPLKKESDSVQTDNKRESNLFRLLIKKMQLDVNFGMLLSNLVMFFIILATGTALFSNGIHQIDTVEQAASALQPVAGKASYFLFAIGVIGTGFLAIPVLSGSLSYIVSETFGWKGGMDAKYKSAPAFYITIILALAIGLGLNEFGISPVKALVYTAVLYGLTSPIIIAIVLHIGNNKKIMGKYTNGHLSNILGIATLALMMVSAIALIYFQFI